MKIQKILLQEMGVPLSLGHVLCSEASLAYMPPILEALEGKSSYGELLGYGTGPIRSSVPCVNQLLDHLWHIAGIAIYSALPLARIEIIRQQQKSKLDIEAGIAY